MIAPRDIHFRALSLGLQPQEQKILTAICDRFGGLAETANDEMELYRLTQTISSTVCVLGQSDATSDPSYLAWLLKGIVNPNKIVLIYSSIDAEEVKKLERYGVRNVVNRPCDPNQLARAVQHALESREEGPRQGFLQSLSRLNPFRKQTPVG